MPPKASSASSPCSAASFALPRALSPASRCARPDRTPDSRHSALPCDAGGRGTALSVKPVRPARLRRPVGQSQWHPNDLHESARPCGLSEPVKPIRSREEPGMRCDDAMAMDRHTVPEMATQGRATQPLRPNYSREAPCPRPGRLPCALSATGRPNTGDKLRSGARVHAVTRRGHSAAPSAAAPLAARGLVPPKASSASSPCWTACSASRRCGYYAD